MSEDASGSSPWQWRNEGRHEGRGDTKGGGRARGQGETRGDRGSSGGQDEGRFGGGSGMRAGSAADLGYGNSEEKRQVSAVGRRGKGRGRGGQGEGGGVSSVNHRTPEEEAGERGAHRVRGRGHTRAARFAQPIKSPDPVGDLGFQYLRVSDGIVGTCTEVERRYVRVQSQPDPKTVRPASILQRSLQAVARREAAGEAYDDTGDFYMSICQDLRLQQIEDKLTVEAREGFAICAMRARVGLPGEDKGMDTKALSDCLLHLHSLYGKNARQPRQLEFAVYRFLMWLGLTATGAPDATAQLNSSLKELAAFSPHPAVSHATDVMAAVLAGDSRRYFSLTASPPASAREQCHVHDTLLAPAVRRRAYETVLKAYKFVIPLHTLTQLFGLQGAEMTDWLDEMQAVYDADSQLLDVDASKKVEKQDQSK